MAKTTDILYARYSSHAQDEGTSIEVQIEKCEQAAGKPLKHYVDKAKTGRTKGGRTALLQLLQDAEDGKLKGSTLWVFNFERFGRAAESHVLVEALEDCGVKVVSAMEGSNKLARGIHLVVAAEFSRALAERTRAGLIKRHEGGFHTGGPAPYGYKIADAGDGKRKLAIDEQESEVVRWMFEEYLGDSLGFKELARKLDKRGVRTRGGKPWRFTTVKGIISNRLLIGEIIYLRRSFKLDRSTGRRKPQANDAAEHKVQVDEALRILDNATFERAQEKLAKNRRDYTPRPRNQTRPFTRLLFCGECGSVCYARKSKNAKGEYYYWGCGCRQAQGPEACPNAVYKREDLLKDWALQGLAAMFEDADDMIAEATAIAEKQVAVHREDTNRLRAELAALDKQAVGLSSLLVDPAMTVAARPAIFRQLGDLEGKRSALQTRLDAQIDRACENTAELAECVRNAFREAKEAFIEAATDTELNRMMETIIGPMTLLANGKVVQKTATAGVAGGRWSKNVAGGGFEPPTSGL